MDIVETIRGALRRKIAERGYPSIERFAHENSIDKTTLYRILNGKREPRISTLFKIASCLELTLNDLYLGTGKNAEKAQIPKKRKKITMLISVPDIQTLQSRLPTDAPLVMELRILGNS